MQFYEISVYQVMIFRLYTVCNKHEMIQIGNDTRDKSQVLSQVHQIRNKCMKTLTLRLQNKSEKKIAGKDMMITFLHYKCETYQHEMPSKTSVNVE